jgi:hypothetical protein
MSEAIGHWGRQAWDLDDAIFEIGNAERAPQGI